MTKFAIIGDVHGQYNHLFNLVVKVMKKYPKAKLVFTGDYIDRGPQSYEVVQLVKNLVEQGRAIALLGNHDQMAIDFCDLLDRGGETYDLWLYNGGNSTINSYCKQINEQSGYLQTLRAFKQTGHLEFLKSLPTYYEDEHFFFSHAPVPKDKYMPIQYRENWRENKHVLIWSTHHELKHKYPGLYNHVDEQEFAREHEGKLAVHGHVHMLRENVWTNRVYHDEQGSAYLVMNDSGCGCHPAAHLSACIAEDGKLIEVITSVD